MLHEFHATGNINKGCNSSFITLVPKTGDPLTLHDYRPINLIGCLYKVIAKVLANRLKKVIGSVVGEAQTAFVAGRNILSWDFNKQRGTSLQGGLQQSFRFIKLGFFDFGNGTTRLPNKMAEMDYRLFKIGSQLGLGQWGSNT